MSEVPARFRDRSIRFANGSVGQNIDVPSPIRSTITRPSAGRPRCRRSRSTVSCSFRPAPREMRRCRSSSLFLAASESPRLIWRTPRLSPSPASPRLCLTLSARGVGTTVANQTQYSFAASAYDVLAAWKVLSARTDIDPNRIGAQGHSRGGSAVLTAAARRFADPVVGRGKGLKAVLAAYPWSGHQFLEPSVGDTEVLILMGDRDEWCSPMQVQGHAQAIRLCGGTARMRLFSGAAHSFDRGTASSACRGCVGRASRTHSLCRRRRGLRASPRGTSRTWRLTDRDLMVYCAEGGIRKKRRDDRHPRQRGDSCFAPTCSSFGAARCCRETIFVRWPPALVTSHSSSAPIVAFVALGRVQMAVADAAG